MASSSTNKAASRRPARHISWNDPATRSVVYQVVALAVVGWVAWFLISNTLHNLSSRNIATGFGFLGREAGFAIGETSIEYSPADTYGRAVWVGILNTLRVAAVGIVLATILGTFIGIARLSKNWLITRLSSGYIEVLRNIPLLLQLFFWYALITENSPGPRQAVNPLPGVFISNRGIKLPAFTDAAGFDYLVWGLLLGIALALILAHVAKRRQEKTGQRMPVARIATALVLGLPLAGWLLGGAPMALEFPELKGFNFVGGMSLSPEFSALLVGLVMYTSAFVAEIVRSGIQSVQKGQWEAAGALGLRSGMVLRLVVLPQALRVIVPPMTSTYLNLVKNSSLAVAIGYPDIVSVVNTTLNQTGQAIEGIMIIMGAYLTVSLSISIFMNWYNRHIALVER
jgi:general L-amino acid transport system permease protein